MELRLKEILNQRGITAKEFSKICGISAPNLSKYIRGDISPTLKSLEKMASSLDISVTELLKEKEAMEFYIRYNDGLHKITASDIIELIDKKE